MLDVITTRPVHVKGQDASPEVVSLLDGPLIRLPRPDSSTQDDAEDMPASDLPAQEAAAPEEEEDWFFDDTPSLPLAAIEAVEPDPEPPARTTEVPLPFAVTSECLVSEGAPPKSLPRAQALIKIPSAPLDGLAPAAEVQYEAEAVPSPDDPEPVLLTVPESFADDSDAVDMLEALEATDEELEDPPSEEVSIHTLTQGVGALPLRVRTTRVGEEPLEPDSPLAKTDGRLRELLTAPELLDAMQEFRVSSAVHHADMLARGLEVLLLGSDHSPSLTPEGWFDDLQRVARQLMAMRPALSYVGFACGQLLYELKLQHSRGDDLLLLKQGLESRIARFLLDEKAAREDLAAEVERLLTPSAVVVTRGDASVLLDALKISHTFGIRVVVPEERPGWEGRLFALQVLELGRSVTLTTDWGLTTLLHDADQVVLEASGLLLDGSVLARAGSHALAQMAAVLGKPVYVASTLQRVDLRMGESLVTTPEQRHPAAVWDHQDGRLEIRNFSAEQVPAALITGIVTEEGPLVVSALRHEVLSRDHLREALGMTTPGAQP